LPFSVPALGYLKRRETLGIQSLADQIIPNAGNRLLKNEFYDGNTFGNRFDNKILFFTNGFQPTGAHARGFLATGILALFCPYGSYARLFPV
jgi:hypothetical protein